LRADAGRNTLVGLVTLKYMILIPSVLVLIDMELVVKAGGMRTLLQALSDGPMDLSNLLTSVFLYLMDSPKTRNYLMPGSEMEVRTF